MLTIEVINNSEQFYSMRHEWNATLDKSGLSTPFLRHEWLSSWWKGYGSDKELFILCLKKDSEIVGFAPLMKYKTKLTGIPITAIGFIANHSVNMDFILVHDEYIHDYAKEIVEFLKKKNITIILSYVKQSSFFLPLLEGIIKKRRLSHNVVRKSITYVDLQGTWQEYLKSKTTSFRDEGRKKRNRLKRLGELKFERSTNSFDVQQIVEMLKSVSDRSWQGRDGIAVMASQQGLEFYKNIINEWSDKEFVDISFLYLNRKPIAYQVGFACNGCFYAFDTAYDEEYHDLSPGLVVINMLLEQLFTQQNPGRLDLGYVANYKKRWSDTEEAIMDVTIFPKTIPGAILLLTNKIKQYMPNKGGRT